MRAHYSRSKTGRFLQELAHLTVNVSAREGAEFFTVRYTVRVVRLARIDGDR